MAQYVVGDIHGQAGLFESLCQRLNLRRGEDQLYLLGDVVACGSAVMPVFRRVMMEAETYRFVLGNHEDNLMANFLPHLTRLRSLAAWPGALKPLLLAAHALLTDRRYLSILDAFDPAALHDSRMDLFCRRYAGEAPGVPVPPAASDVAELRNLLREIALELHDDEVAAHDVYACLACGLHGYRPVNTYRTLLPELAGLDEGSYQALLDFLSRQPFERSVTAAGKRVLLLHYFQKRHLERHAKRPYAFDRSFFPVLRVWDGPLPDQICFGHIPLARWAEFSDVAIDPLYPLHYTDDRGIRYCNLDTIESGALTAVRLEDGAEYQVVDTRLANYDSGIETRGEYARRTAASATEGRIHDDTTDESDVQQRQYFHAERRGPRPPAPGGHLRFR